jgi:hypothetical protein
MVPISLMFGVVIAIILNALIMFLVWRSRALFVKK